MRSLVAQDCCARQLAGLATDSSSSRNDASRLRTASRSACRQASVAALPAGAEGHRVLSYLRNTCTSRGRGRRPSINRLSIGVGATFSCFASASAHLKACKCMLSTSHEVMMLRRLTPTRGRPKNNCQISEVLSSVMSRVRVPVEKQKKVMREAFPQRHVSSLLR